MPLSKGSAAALAASENLLALEGHFCEYGKLVYTVFSLLPRVGTGQNECPNVVSAQP
jgi:hypothetical protein